MYGQVHANYVLYKENPEPGHRYLQIAVHELDEFHIRIFRGDVLQPAPDFLASSEDAEAYFRSDLQSALALANEELEASLMAGWLLYST